MKSLEPTIETRAADFTSMTNGQLASLACVLEVSAPKPGNVHRGADFEDMTFNDFLLSAIVLGQAIDHGIQGVGATILKAVELTQNMVGKNTNLGMVLLLVPLTANKDWVSQNSTQEMQKQMSSFLAALNEGNCQMIFEAIRKAKPGGLGSVPESDIDDLSVTNIQAAMRLAADRDLIARQYSNGFGEIFYDTVVLLEAGLDRFADINKAIVFAHVNLMSRFPDTLIERKCGKDVSHLSSLKAQKAVDALEESDEEYWKSVSDLDLWLRSDGHRRNPGTTADMIAAGLYVALKTKRIQPPF